MARFTGLHSRSRLFGGTWHPTPSDSRDSTRARGLSGVRGTPPPAGASSDGRDDDRVRARAGGSSRQPSPTFRLRIASSWAVDAHGPRPGSMRPRRCLPECSQVLRRRQSASPSGGARAGGRRRRRAAPRRPPCPAGARQRRGRAARRTRVELAAKLANPRRVFTKAELLRDVWAVPLR